MALPVARLLPGDWRRFRANRFQLQGGHLDLARGVQEGLGNLPEAARLGRPLQIPDGQSEYEIIDYFQARASEGAAGMPS